MSYRNIRVVCATILMGLFVTSCGFERLYSYENNTVLKQFADIKVKIIADRSGQQLRNLLMIKLTPYGQPSSPKYTLDIQLNYTKLELGVMKDATASRAQIKAIATFTLRDLEKDKVVSNGTAEGIAEYNIMANADFATLSAENNAREVVLEDIADSIRRHIAGSFALQPHAD